MKSWGKAVILALFLAFTAFATPLLGAEDMKKEIALGEKVAADLEKHWERVGDPALAARLSMLLGRFVPLMSRPLPYEVRVVREKMINAFSLPGGIIYFTTGMLDFLRTDGEVAAIMAHELVHADKRHVVIQAARASKINLAALALIIASQGSAGPMILTSLAQVAVTNSYSKDLEREADREGFRILVEAGFPPAAMVTAFEAMIYDQLKRPYVDPGVFMTHPELSERVAYILKMAEERSVPMRRKKALNLLRPSLEKRDGRAFLLLDGKAVWSLPDEGDNIAVLAGAEEKIDSFLQMEIAPYEIEVLDLRGNKALRVGPSVVVKEPLPIGAEPLDDFREALVRALGDARDKHKGAKYLR